MKRVAIVLSLALMLTSTVSRAQLMAPNDMGVSMGAFWIDARDVEATKKFLGVFGGTQMKIDGIDVIKFPGIFFFIQPGTPPIQGKQQTIVFCACPNDGQDTSAINHIGFNLQHYDEVYAKAKSMGYRLEDFHGAKDRAMLIGPDGLMFEIAGSRSLTTPVGEPHIHTFVNDTPPPDRDHQVVGYEMALWYHHFFGTKINEGGPGSGLGTTMPGINLRIAETRLPVSPTKGHVVDHISFEVKNLEPFCKNLQMNGIKLDQPYSTTRHASFASCTLTDPWGTTIELTEGLSKF